MIRRWRQFTPFYIYPAVAFCVGTAAAKRLSVDVIFLLLALGFLCWGLLEYAIHRFVFHHDAQSDVGRKFLYATHLSHHENPRSTDRLFASLLMSFPIATSYWLLMWAVTASWRVASYLFIGLITGYLYYEWVHFQTHHGKPRLRILRYLKKYHLLHHYRTPNLRFGVTSPLFDLIFGTFQPVATHR